jgi:hypothetical protein
MPPEPQNPISEENSIPLSPQGPSEPASENTAYSEPSVALPEALESSPSDFSVKSNDIPPSDSTPTEPEKEPENQVENKPVLEPISEPVEAPEPQTAQIPVNEPLASQSKTSFARELLITARNVIQFRKRKKLDRVMSLFLQQSKITNDEVEKFLHVSDATATRYLSQLEKEGKIKQSGKTGKGVSYSRI